MCLFIWNLIFHSNLWFMFVFGHPRFCHSCFTTLVWKMMWILLIGQLLLSIHVKLLVRKTMDLTRRKFVGFSLLLNLLLYLDDTWDCDKFNIHLSFDWNFSFFQLVLPLGAYGVGININPFWFFSFCCIQIQRLSQFWLNAFCFSNLFSELGIVELG